MANTNSTQSSEVTRSSLADIASRLEVGIAHLCAMMELSRESSIDNGTTLSLLAAMEHFTDEISKATNDLYQEAWKFPVPLFERGLASCSEPLPAGLRKQVGRMRITRKVPLMKNPESRQRYFVRVAGIYLEN